MTDKITIDDLITEIFNISRNNEDNGASHDTAGDIVDFIEQHRAALESPGVIKIPRGQLTININNADGTNMFSLILSENIKKQLLEAFDLTAEFVDL